MANPYVSSWNIRSFSNSDKVYKVSQRQNGDYACSCPHFIYRHKICKHIEAVIQQDIERKAIEVHQAARQVLEPKREKVRVQVRDEEFEVEELKLSSALERLA